jgi:tRNA-dihydrouridine synthase B
MLQPFHIGPVRVWPPTVLAPMAGITDEYFRKIVKQVGGVGLVTMEFVSADSIALGIEKTREMMRFCESERPLSIQIYGSKPDPMASAARYVQEIGADIVDINMGCPANQVLKGCAGAALMGDLALARRIVAACRKQVSIPLTVKFRLGLDSARINYLELGRICEGEGVDAVALHGRTAKQMYSGHAAWENVARLKEHLSIPVMGNGDVVEPEDAFGLQAQSGCDGVMIGRASMKNPWIYKQIEDIAAGRPKTQPTWRERRDLILRHFAMLEPHPNRSFALFKIKKFTGWYSHGLQGGAQLRQQLNQQGTPEHFIALVREFFDKLEALERAAA